MKISVTIRTLFITNESIESVLNFLKKHLYLYEKMNSKYREEQKNRWKEMNTFEIDRFFYFISSLSVCNLKDYDTV